MKLKRLDTWQVISFVILGLYAVFLLLPMFQLLCNSVIDPEGNISLYYSPENDFWSLQAHPAGSAGTTSGQCALNLYETKTCSYCFTYSMNAAGLGHDTPVDGRAELATMTVNNLKKK